MRPADFWDLHPLEFWWLVEARRPTRMYGRLTEDDVADLYDETFGNPNHPLYAGPSKGDE